MPKPSLCIFMICKNEARDIARALLSAASLADQVVIVDTGSTDETERVIRETVPPGMLHFETYLDASELDFKGDWKLWSFSKARNHAIEIAERTGCSWLMWMDADDELLDPAPVARALYRDDMDGFHILIRAGSMAWPHFRLWKTDKRVRFKARIHEYPVIHHLRTEQLLATIAHHSEASEHQEDGNERNLRILMREWEENPDARTAFYMADTHRYGGRPAEAAEWFRERIGFGEGANRDEWLFSHLYLSRVLCTLGDYAGAENVIAGARVFAPDWAEFIAQDANIAYARKDFPRAIELARAAIDMPIPFTQLWREPYAYRDQAPRLISWCHEHMGQLPEAIAWAEIAADRIGQADEDWQRRSERLKAQLLAQSDPPPAIVTRRRRRVALVRPGAIGDILMTLNLVPVFKAANPDTDVHYFCAGGFAKPDMLAPIMLKAGVDLVLDVAGLKARTKDYDRVIPLIGYQVDWAKNCRKPMTQHLLRYFAEEMGLPSDGELPSLELPRPKSRFEDYVTLQIGAGWSKYKQWRIERWQQVVSECEDVNFILIGEESTPQLYGAFPIALGHSLPESIALIANARAHVGLDSFANHLTHYRWSGRRVPGVILFGSTDKVSTGYPTNVNLSAGLACQPCFKENPAISSMSLGPCENPPRASYDDETPWACMEAISVEQVVQAIRSVLK